MRILAHFLNEWLLWGALAGVVPIILHLLHRSRYRVESWGAMMFLQESVQAKAKIVKFQRIFLMVLRCAFFALLAIALARPIVNPEKVAQTADGAAVASSPQPPTTHVLIIDSSYSLQFGDHRLKVFDLVRHSALEIVRKMADGDNMLIIRAGHRPRPLFRRPSADRDLLQRRVESMAPGNEKADLLAAVTQACHMLSESNNAKHRIYVLTDNQRECWLSPNDPRWGDFIKLKELLKVKPSIYVLPHELGKEKANTQIQRVYSSFPIVDVYRQNHFIVEIRNNGEPRKIRVDFYSGKKLEGEREVKLERGVNSVGFDCSFNKPGSHYVTARIPADQLNVDNSYTLALKVTRQIPVLLIEGNSSEDPFTADGGYLKMALTSAAGANDESLIAVTSRNQTDLDRLDSAYMARYKSIILVNVSSMSSFFRARLENFVNQGGGLLVALGKDANIDSYNTMFKDNDGLLPALLTGQSPKQSPPIRPTFHAGVTGAVLDNFDLSRTKVLEETRITRFMYATAADDARVLASFDDHPFLLQKAYGKGHVIMWTTSMNSAWTNLPVTTDYLPLVQNIVIFLSSNIKPPINLNLGETMLFAATLPRVRLRDRSIRQTADVTSPDGRVSKMALQYSDGQWIGQFEDTLMPGLYSVGVGDNMPQYYAVRLDPEEGNLNSLKTSEMNRLGRALGGAFCPSMASMNKLIERENSAVELWRHVLFFGLILLMVELYLGWRFN